MGTNRRAKALQTIAIGALTVALAACGGGSDSTTPTPTPTGDSVLSGVLTSFSAFQIDGDVNDASAPLIANNSASAPQVLNTSASEAALIVAGFVTTRATGEAGDRFAQSRDLSDYYQIEALDGQAVYLSFEPEPGVLTLEADLDLVLYDADGETIRAASGSSSNSFEVVLIPEDGTFIIEVRAFSGASTYTLSVSSELSAPARLSQFEPASVAVGELTALRAPQTETGQSFLAAHVEHWGRDGTAAGARLRNFSPRNAALNLRANLPADRPALYEQALTAPNFENTAFHNAYTDALATWDVAKSLNALEGDDVFAVRQNARVFQVAPPSDPVPSETLQWNLYAVDWDDADAEGLFPILQRPLIAVLDDGFFTSHPEFAGRLTDQRDFVTAQSSGQSEEDGLDADGEDAVDPAQPEDADTGNGCHGFHGTHVASTAMALRGNGGIVGVYPGADLMAIRLGRNIPPTCRQIFDYRGAIRYAADLSNNSGARPPKAADVINMSFGGPSFNESEADAIQAAVDQGLILVAAAGNDGDRRAAGQFPSYPAAYDGVIAVGATSIQGTPSFFSSFYPQVDIAAPGGASGDLNDDGFTDAIAAGIAILNDDETGFDPGLGLKIGTSMASPHVAAGFALMKAIEPNLTSADIEAFLANGDLTVDIGAPGKDNQTGYGLMSLEKMIDAAQRFSSEGAPTPPPTAAPSPMNLDFSGGLEAITVDIQKVGVGALSISGLSGSGLVRAGGGWVQARPVSVDSDGFGTYAFYLNPETAPAGSASGQALIQLSNGASLSLPVSASVNASAASVPAPITVRLERRDGAGFVSVATQTFTDIPVGGQEVSFSHLGDGEYRLVYGTDLDQDGRLCDPGEFCGRFPTAFSGQETVSITNGAGVQGASFALRAEDVPADITPLSD